MADTTNDPHSERDKPDTSEHLSQAEAFKKIEELREEIDPEDKIADEQDEP